MSIDIQADLQNVEQAREIDEEYLRHERQSASAGGARYRNPWHCFHCVTQTAMKKGAGADPNFERRSENTGTIGGGL